MLTQVTYLSNKEALEMKIIKMRENKIKKKINVRKKENWYCANINLNFFLKTPKNYFNFIRKEWKDYLFSFFYYSNSKDVEIREFYEKKKKSSLLIA